MASCVTWRLLVLMLLLSDVAQALVSEGSVLLRVKSYMIDRRGVLDNWGASSDPCYGPWNGVVCRKDDTGGWRTVSMLRLPHKFLAGSVSTLLTGLAGLENVQWLILTGNFFSGQIPSNIVNLKNLETLDLGDNMLEASLPQFPSNLRELHLQNNFLTGDIGLSNVFNLSLNTLDLRGNSFTGKLPALIKETKQGMVGYMNLDLSHNKLEGHLPLDFGDLRVGRFCYLSHNNFEGEIPDGPYDDFDFLDLSANSFTGSVPRGLLRWREYLNLSTNSLSGKIDFAEFKPERGGARSRFLDLSFNKLENEVDLEIGNLALEYMELLDLRNNRFSGSLEGIFRALRSNIPNLRELRVGGNEFQGGELPLLLTGARSYFLSLQVLDLSGSGLTGEIPSEVFRNENLPPLKILDLSSNHLHGILPVSLTLMPELRELRLGDNSLEGGINVNRCWTNLEVFDLSHNSFQYSGAEIQRILDSCTSLRELRLGGSISNRTVLPAPIKKLPSLEILDLSRCNLSGTIPEQWSRQDLLPSLKYLNLSSNSLEGSLPAGFGRMPELIQMNVSKNQLSGELPAFRIRFFDPTSFAGNEGLCGPPLAECPRELASGTLEIWQLVILVLGVVIASGGSCLLLGWMWRKNVDARRQAQDAEMIATLVEGDATTVMPLPKLRKATDDFSHENQIGIGGFGTVYKGELEYGTVVAIKKSERNKSQFLNEVKILSQVHHRNLVRLLGCCLANETALLVFEFIPNGTLAEHLHQERGRPPLTWNQRLTIATQTAGALDYLHSSANRPIYHLDVKSANILLDHNMNAKLADFGLSKLAAAPDASHITRLSGLEGTFGYMDPESMVKTTLTGKSDVYAFGVVLLEVISAKAVLDSSRGEDVSLVAWAERLILQGKLEEILDPVILDTFHTLDGKESINAVAALALRCLRFRSEERPTMKQASRHLLHIQESGPSVSI